MEGLCVETVLQFSSGIPSTWCITNLTCIMGHVLYGHCGPFNAPQADFSRMMYTFQTLLSRVKWCSELDLDRSPNLARLVTFYSTWQTDVPQMLCLIYAFSLYLFFFCNSQFQLHRVFHFQPFATSLFGFSQCRFMPHVVRVVQSLASVYFFFNAFCESSSVEPGVHHFWPDSKCHHYFSAPLLTPSLGGFPAEKAKSQDFNHQFVWGNSENHLCLYYFSVFALGWNWELFN